jgi:hypothetical protein
MTQRAPRADLQPDRRRSERRALSLDATVRAAGRSKVKARVIDISTHGCRIECTGEAAPDTRLWLSIAGLESQDCRVVWRAQEFAGLEFDRPLAESVLERLLGSGQQLSEANINELRVIASRTHGLAARGQANDIHALAELSRSCAVDAVVEGLRLTGARRPTGS